MNPASWGQCLCAYTSKRVASGHESSELVCYPLFC